MANNTNLTLDTNSPTTVDCGFISYYHLENFHGTDVKQIAVDGFNRPIKASSVVDGWCTGSTTFQGSTSGFTYAQVIKLEPPFAEFLMGLAGIICALLIVKAFMR